MAEFLIETIGLPPWLSWTAIAGLSAFLILNVIAGGALVFIWAERKIAARIQDRLGPTRTGGRFGWLQSLADGIKLLAKEDLMPDGADVLLFRIAPYVSFALPSVHSLPCHLPLMLLASVSMLVFSLW